MLAAMGIVAAAMLAGGCASWQLPRIDPSGQRLLVWPTETPPVYAPPPGVAAPAPMVPGAIAPPFGNIQAAPVYPDVPTAPLGPVPVTSGIASPFTPTVVGPPVATAAPLAAAMPAPALSPGVLAPPPGAVPIGQDHLRITPDRVIAPIGSEIVLKAGICSAAGYLLASHRVEWLLDRDGAGQFVDLGDRDQVDLFRWAWDTPRKIDNWYAIGATACASECLRQGNADPYDDVQIVRGEAWITVTSATSGTSRVTAYAPSIENWQFRRSTSTIYWIDAQWVFPPSATVEPGRPQVLTTTIARRSDGAPLAGWLVRFDVPGGAASLGYGGGSSVDVPTDANGRASVEVSPAAGGGGAATVGITIIRPAQAPPDASPQLEVARGAATINWGGATAAPVAPGPISPLPISPAPVTPTTPTTPAPFTPTPRPSQGTGPSSAFTPPPDEPAAQPDLEMSLTYLGASKEVAVGEFISYELTVVNRGSGVARGVVVRDDFYPGLRHEMDPANAHWVENKTIGDLRSGQSGRLTLTFQVIAAGPQCHEVRVSAEGLAPKTQSDCVRGWQPSLNVSMTTLERQEIGQLAQFNVLIVNGGQVRATNVEAVLQFDPALQAAPAGADQEALPDGRIRIRLGNMAVGERRTIQVAARCVAASMNAFGRVAVTADGGFSQNAEDSLEILPRLPGP